MKTEDIQQGLVNAGYDLGKTGPNGDGVDGDAGPLTMEALQAFRVNEGLVMDVGPDTAAKLQWYIDTEDDSGTQPGPTPPPTDQPTVPPAWMPACQMDRIIFHWTAGTLKANASDLDHYHILIEGDGTLVRGNKSIVDNVSTADGVYAAHTANCNTGSIGVSLCGMSGAVENPFNAGPYPINEIQWDVLSKVLRDLCRSYGISVTPQTVLSHAEVQGTLGIPQAGKWDIARLPWDKSIMTAAEVGGQMRDKVKALLAVPKG